MSGVLTYWLRQDGLAGRAHPFSLRACPGNNMHHSEQHTTLSVVVLAFKEMHTLYASRREICTQKFGNATIQYQHRETNDAFQKHLYHHQTIQQNTEIMFANDAQFPFTKLVCLPWSFASCSLRCAETQSCSAYAVTHHFHGFWHS